MKLSNENEFYEVVTNGTFMRSMEWADDGEHDGGGIERLFGYNENYG